MNPADLSAGDIASLGFSDLVGLVNEPNTPSGGLQTIRRIATLLPGTARQILDVGCNTGFASVELSLWTGATVTGLDVNPQSLRFARDAGRRAGCRQLRLVRGDALSLPFTDNRFDVLYVNNVSSFVASRERAAREYYRVLRPGGLLVAVPIYYHTHPPEALRQRVAELIGAPVPVRGLEQWRECFGGLNRELVHHEEHEYINQSLERIRAYADEVLRQPHLAGLAAQTHQALHARLVEMYEVFNENLRYARFAILMFRSEAVFSSLNLYTTYPVSNGDADEHLRPHSSTARRSTRADPPARHAAHDGSAGAALPPR